MNHTPLNSNSNMVQSIGPQTHHGQQLYDMFCYSYDRPNCLGGSLMAEHAINYTQQFIDTYSNRAEPWAAFINFIDSHEDSSTLISYLDEILGGKRRMVILNKSDLAHPNLEQVAHLPQLLCPHPVCLGFR